MFERYREKVREELKQEIIAEMDEHEQFHADGGRNLDEHREIESLVKSRLGAHHVLICAHMLDGTVLTYIPEEIGDKDLVYLIQTLKDLRNERLIE